MAFNGSGIFQRIHNWVSDAAAAINITDTRMDAEMDGFATGLSTCVTKDGQTIPTANLPMGGFRHTNVGNSSSRTSYPSTAQLQDGTLTYGVDTGVVNAYLVSLSPAPTAYVDGMHVFVKILNTNTAASTINVNSLGVKSITTSDGVALISNELIAGQVAHLIYNGTNFNLISNENILSRNNVWTGTQTLSSKSLWLAEGAAIASAATTNIWTTDGNYNHVTGTATITSLGTAPQAGVTKHITADGAFTITDNASIICPGNANIVCAADDEFDVVADSTTVARIVNFTRASGMPIVSIDTNSIQNGAVTQGKLASSSVGIAQLRTANAGVSTNTGQALLTLPGGSLGFYPQLNVAILGNTQTATLGSGVNAATAAIATLAWTTTAVSHIALGNSGGAVSTAIQSYFIASPPYNLGDGDIPLFLFAEVDPTGKVVSAYSAPDAPWHYNGPTNIKADSYKDGKAFHNKRQFLIEHGSVKNAIAKGMSREQALDELALSPLVSVEITQAVKNADMNIIPHPFLSKSPGNTVVLIDPVSVMCEKLCVLHECGESVLELLHDGYITLGAKVNRFGPTGVDAISVKWKLTK